MRLQFDGRAVLDQKTGDFRILAHVGGMPIECIVERGAVTAGLNAICVSDAQAMLMFEARIREIETVASQRFFNGELSPAVKQQHMFLQ